MKAIILAGGKGMRLKEVIKDLPKPMAPVSGRPFIEYLILQLAKWQIRKIVLSVGYKRDVIKSYFGRGENLGVQIEYSEEDEPLGTGGAIRKSMNMINDESCVVMNGDSFLDLNFNDFISFHNNKGSSVTLALAAVSNTNRYGSVEIDGNQAVLRFEEKGRIGSGLINGGVYILNREIVNNIAVGEVSLENNVLPGLIGNGLYGMVSRGYFVDIGVPEDYFGLCSFASEPDGSPLKINGISKFINPAFQNATSGNDGIYKNDELYEKHVNN